MPGSRRTLLAITLVGSMLGVDAQAAPGRAPKPASPAEQRRAVMRAALDDGLGFLSLPTREQLRLLGRYAFESEHKKQNGPVITVVEHGGAALDAGWQMFYRGSIGRSGELRAEELKSLGFDTLAAFEAHVGRRVVEIARVAGDPSSPKTQAAAVARLRRIIDDTPWLLHHQNGREHPDLKLFADMNAKRLKLGQPELALVLWRGSEGTLTFERKLGNYDRADDSAWHRLLFYDGHARVRPATLADLRLAKMETRDEFNHAVERGLSAIALEDLD